MTKIADFRSTFSRTQGVYLVIYTTPLPFIYSKLFWYLFCSKSRCSSTTPSASSFITFWMRYMLLNVIYRETKLLAIVNGTTFPVSDFLRLFMISFNYDLVLPRYSSTDSVLLLSPLLSYSIYLLLQNILALTGL